MFESLAQSKLQQGIKLKLVPMVKRESGGSGRRKKLPRWHSDHGDGANPSSARQIDFIPARTEGYSSSPGQIEDKVYYVLEAEDQVAFDSFIMSDTKLYIFQFSIGSNHLILSLYRNHYRQRWAGILCLSFPPGLRRLAALNRGTII